MPTSWAPGKKNEETIRLHMEIHGDLLIMRFPEWILIIYIYNISNVFSITSQNRYFSDHPQLSYIYREINTIYISYDANG